MPRSQQANEQRRQESTSKLLEAARTVYARKGSAATMAEIVKEAGVSQGLPYRYFRTKRALFAAVFKELTQNQESLARGFRSMTGTPGQRFERIVTRMVELRRQSPEITQLYREALERRSVPGHLRRDLLEYGAYVRKTLRALIVEGQATGEIVDGDPDQLLGALVACLEGLSRFGAGGPAMGSFPEAAVVLRMFRPAPGASPPTGGPRPSSGTGGDARG